MALGSLSAHAVARDMMLDEGKKTFRYDTFGDEAFWGDALQRHKAIAGEKHGGDGPGVSAKTALSFGLKVDADAVPDALKKQIAAGKGICGLGKALHLLCIAIYFLTFFVQCT